MKKKLTLGITIVALATMAIVGGTLAWFTSSDSVTNTIKTGKVVVEVTEPKFDQEDGNLDNVVSDVVPGAVITKDPTITNAGEDAQIRYFVETKLVDKNGEKMEIPADKNLAFANAYNGFKTNEWVDLGTVLKGAAPIVLFDSVNIPTSWGNEYQEATLTVEVSVQAVQAANTENVENIWADAGMVKSN